MLYCREMICHALSAPIRVARLISKYEVPILS